MPLRVTSSMMHIDFMRNLNRNTSRMSESQLQLSTGRKINRPSDDPVGITYALRYRSEISINDQYKRNIDSAKGLVDHTDTVLSQINEVYQRVQELTVQGLNGTNPQSALDAIVSELDQLYKQAVTLGNDQMNGKYTFNGEFTDVPPYTEANAMNESTDDAKIYYQFAAGITIPVNITGNEVFGTDADADNFFGIIKNLQAAFTANDKTAAGTQLELLKGRMDKFLAVRSEVGAVANRIELMENRITDMDLNLNSLSGKTEDADLAEVITQLQTQENIYQASLAAGARIIQPSLVDYLS